MEKIRTFLAAVLLAILGVPAVAGANTDDQVIQVAAGYAHACALLQSGSVYCWGASWMNGAETDSSLAREVNGLPKIKSISAGQINSCAIDMDDQAWCWGVDLQASIKSKGMSRLMLKSAKRASPVINLCSFRYFDKMLFR